DHDRDQPTGGEASRYHMNLNLWWESDTRARAKYHGRYFVATFSEAHDHASIRSGSPSKDGSVRRLQAAARSAIRRRADAYGLTVTGGLVAATVYPLFGNNRN